MKGKDLLAIVFLSIFLVPLLIVYLYLSAKAVKAFITYRRLDHTSPLMSPQRALRRDLLTSKWQNTFAILSDFPACVAYIMDCSLYSCTTSTASW